MMLWATLALRVSATHYGVCSIPSTPQVPTDFNHSPQKHLGCCFRVFKAATGKKTRNSEEVLTAEMSG